ncbi:Uma2 family endonuclease [Actinoplanes sp. NPDC026670]|uniref:Uma2 family endonuclease n=1 Tax=Actinoplanes sp. NPDC026670 TaxID=3154700 RepID=UPI00340B3E99
MRLDQYPDGGEWTVSEIDEFPEDNHRREVVEGSLILRPAQTPRHSSLVMHICGALDRTRPEAFDVVHGMQIRFAENTALVPDLVAVRADCKPMTTTFFDPEDVVLAVEVVDDRSRFLDRVLKPAIYAAAGIPHFWRVESAGAVVHAHRLDPDKAEYLRMSAIEARIRVRQPWEVDAPLATRI